MKNTYYVIINKYFVEFQLTSEDFDPQNITESSLLESGAVGAEVTNDDTNQQQNKKKSEKEDTCMLQINAIMMCVKELEEKIEKIQSGQDSYEYRHMDEMLTRNLEALDTIETGGNEDLRQLRKNCVEVINRCISCLESKRQPSEETSSNLMANTASSNQV